MANQTVNSDKEWSMLEKMATEEMQIEPVKKTSSIAWNVQAYMHDRMQDEISHFNQAGNIKSGYANLDYITNIYPGLYVIGAISSLGKTTFIHQMCDQMAMNGEYILYFSLEQSALELTSKSLSRIMAKKNTESALTSLQIRKYGLKGEVAKAVTEYEKYANHMTIVECDFDTTMDDIEAAVTEYIERNSVKPIVVVDYLQVIQEPPNSRMSKKDLVDMHVKKLKQMQKNKQLAVFVISSLNRQNYMTQIDYESFKESGSVEYGADVIWGLQLEVLHDPIFDKVGQINEKRQKIKKSESGHSKKYRTGLSKEPVWNQRI